ncbi:MAG TPA: GatB/YqeY domain-containing protein [Kineosporiaceae bacterium]|nr:GatB/YqeY domain-containing protein [Kineosporiaceae bacterium]
MPDTTAATLKARLQSDLTESMRARDELRTATLRMALTAIRSEEVAGSVARELADAEVQTVIGREAKKRREAATAFDGAGRPEKADRERAELTVLLSYLPAQLSDDDITALVAEEVAAASAAGATGVSAMGRVMKAVQPRVAGRAEGGRVAAEVKRQLAR